LKSFIPLVALSAVTSMTTAIRSVKLTCYPFRKCRLNALTTSR
jgi:hypothetical protein